MANTPSKTPKTKAAWSPQDVKDQNAVDAGTASTGERQVSRQALYNKRRREQIGGGINIFPSDRVALNAAVEASGLSQAQWLRDAIDEKIKRQNAAMRRIANKQTA